MAKRKSNAVERETKKRWKELERGTITKWEKGKIVVGMFKGMRKAGKGFVFDIITDEGFSTVGAPTILQSYLNRVEIDDEIRVSCLGKIDTPNGMAWDFTVEVAE